MGLFNGFLLFMIFILYLKAPPPLNFRLRLYVTLTIRQASKHATKYNLEKPLCVSPSLTWLSFLECGILPRPWYHSWISMLEDERSDRAELSQLKSSWISPPSNMWHRGSAQISWAASQTQLTAVNKWAQSRSTKLSPDQRNFSDHL